MSDKLEVSVMQSTAWNRALNAARRTVGKEPITKDPSSKWKLSMLLAEHSPIRLVEYDVVIKNIRQWVTTHLVRHKFGVEHFVHTQRVDRNNSIKNRDELPQGSLNDLQESMNTQALINISRKRLCNMASPETREAWRKVKEQIATVDPETAACMVPECVYRGFCPEPHSCGYARTAYYLEALKQYRKPCAEQNLSLP
jgi:thymidylate synthase ThyX